MPKRAPRNRTLTCTDDERNSLAGSLLELNGPADRQLIKNQLILGDIFEIAGQLPTGVVDLLVLDPPYNLTRDFGGHVFRKRSKADYSAWFQRLIELLIPTLKPTATIYVCSDWITSTQIFPVLADHFHVRNRITWEREKGRGAKMNWKNNTEDIWFCTVSNQYFFDVEAVKLKRRVVAPYRLDGKPKDWKQESSGNFRLTYPSNIWTDITVPFWSMPENTQHPTQKPEKLIAKLILASSQENDFVLDPFLGSGTTAVVAEKLRRRWCGIDINPEYLCWALKRIKDGRVNTRIQGLADGVFWERHSMPKPKRGTTHSQNSLFDRVHTNSIKP